jgi:hypothetical protein
MINSVKVCSSTSGQVVVVVVVVVVVAKFYKYKHY